MSALINKDQAFVNILQRAINEGYELGNYNSIEETLIEAEDYLINNCEADRAEYCEVVSNGPHQHTEYEDGFGTRYSSSGEIIDYHAYRYAEPNTKHVYATIVNVKGEVIALYETLNLTI